MTATKMQGSFIWEFLNQIRLEIIFFDITAIAKYVIAMAPNRYVSVHSHYFTYWMKDCVMSGIDTRPLSLLLPQRIIYLTVIKWEFKCFEQVWWHACNEGSRVSNRMLIKAYEVAKKTAKMEFYATAITYASSHLAQLFRVV